MWIEKAKTRTDLNDCKLFELLKINQDVEWKALDRFAQHNSILSGAMIALLAAGGAALAAPSNKIKILAFFIPLFVVYLRRFSIETLDRYYQRFLEAVVYTTKIEFLLGLNRPVWPIERNPEIDAKSVILFKKDRSIDVDRRIISSINEELAQSSGEWIYSLLWEGHNRVVWRLFKTIFLGSYMIPILAVIVFWDSKNCATFTIAYLKMNIWPLLGAFASIFIATFIYRSHSNEIEKKRKKDTRFKSYPKSQ